jgi:hypothetical protein
MSTNNLDYNEIVDKDTIIFQQELNKFLNSRGINNLDSAKKVYVYGKYQDVSLYNFPLENIAVVKNHVVNGFYVFEGKTQVQDAFMVAKSLSIRYTSIGDNLN